MTVIVEVPDHETLQLAQSLVGDRADVTVQLPRAASAGTRPGAADSLRRVLISWDDIDPDESWKLLQEGVWAVIPADSASINQLLVSYVDDIQDGLCPLLVDVSRDRERVRALLGEIHRLDELRGQISQDTDNPLSPGEIRILQRIASGMTSQEIADELGFQLQTVKNKVTAILTKTEARSRTHAVSIALGQGWISRAG